MFASLRDCVPTIQWSRHLDSPQTLLKSFEEEIDGYLKEKILDRLCLALEEDLRLSSHLHLKLDDRNPFKVHMYIESTHSQLVSPHSVVELIVVGFSV